MLTCLAACLAALRDRLVGALYRRHAVELDGMPGHPERLRPTGDPVVDAEFWDTAEALLDDPNDPDLSEINDRWGWPH